ncbi:MAG: type II CAAX endopeptidase family protein [Pseudomonadota bacterium]
MTFVTPGENRLGIGWGVFFGGILVVMLGFFLWGILYGVGLALLMRDGAIEFLQGGGAGPSPFGLIGLLATFIGAMIGLWIAVKAILRRPFWVITWSGWSEGRSGFGKLALIYGGIVAVASSISIFLGAVEPNVAFSTWVQWLPLLLIMILIQVSAEELFFRGYLQRILIDWYQSRLIWLIIPSLVFGMLHFQPSTLGPNAWIVVLATFIFGLIAGELTFRTGSIGPAIGVHFINNVNAMLITELDAGISGFALFKTPYTADDIEMVRDSLILATGFFALLFILVWYFWPKPKMPA